MKKLLYILLFSPFVGLSQVPQGVNYQAVAYDANGFELANQGIRIQISLLEGSPSADISYTEQHTVTTDHFGMFSIIIGQGETIHDFTELDWSKSNFLRVEMDTNLDGSYSLLGVTAFNSVPYSFMAENIMNPEGLKDNMGNHRAAQTLDMDSNFVSRVLAPELPLDAANKQYVDDMIGDITTGEGRIVFFKYHSSDVEVYTYNDAFRILTIVPNNKIVIFKNQLIVEGGFAMPQINKFGTFYTSHANIYGNESHGNLYGFPGDTILTNSFDSIQGFFYEFDVSKTQIDANTTSFSMVTLDEEAISSGGTITDGEVADSGSQGEYMISSVSEETMSLFSAMSYCRNLDQQGCTDWFLPTLEDLYAAFSGKLIEDPVNNLNADVWTSSPNFQSRLDGRGYRVNIFSLSNYRWSTAESHENMKLICIRKE
jgi:hypothetical protein